MIPYENRDAKIMLIIISYRALYFSWQSASTIVIGNQNDHHLIHIHCDAKNHCDATNFKLRSFCSSVGTNA